MKENQLQSQNITLSRSVTPSQEDVQLYTERRVLQHLKTPRKMYSPETHASYLSKILLLWVDPLIRMGTKKVIVESDLPSQTHDLFAKNVKQSFSNVKGPSTDTEASPPKYTTFFRNHFSIDAHEDSIFVHVFHFCKYFLLKTACLKLVTTICSIASPLILYFLLEVLARGDGQTPLGFCLSILLFLTSITYAYALQHHYWIGYKHSIQVRNALMVSLYQKLFKAAASTNRLTGGQLINLLAVDCPVIVEFVWNPHDCWAAPLSVTANITVLFLFVGWGAFVPVAYVLVLIPFNRYIAAKLVSLSDNILKWTDARVGQISQVLLGMRFLKFYNAENYFLNLIRTSRQNELKAVNSNGLVRLRMNVTWLVTPSVLSLMVFAIMVLTGREITPAIVFPVLSLMNVLQDAVNRFYTDGINLLAASVVSLKRIQTFLETEEMQNLRAEKDANYAVTIKQGYFAWDMEPVLKDINLEVPHGQLCTVVGSIGCGKTSLINAILSSMKRLSGEVRVSGSIAYTSQQAWLFHGTIKENILFGKSYDEARYQQAIKCSALDRDIARMPEGDQTMIGERGINLSGGQKQRVAIARAVYSDCDIYVFDEPLGAVDPSVASWIFHYCLLGALRNKTRILVTHQVQFLPLSDVIVVMKSGEIQKVGTYKELTESGTDLSSIVALQTEKMQQRQAAQAEEQTDQEDAGAHIPQLQEVRDLAEVSQEFAVKETLVEEEERETGSVRMSVFYNYFTASNKFLYIVIILLYFISQGARVVADFWLAFWSDNSEKDKHSVYYYLGIYAACVTAHAVLVYVRERTLLWLTMSSAAHLHQKMLESVSRAPMHFFDSTPAGRILNRFSKDMKIIDLNLFYIISDIGSYGIVVLSAVAVVAVLLPWLVIPIVATAAASFLVQYFYQQTSRELKRMEAVSRSPVLSIFSQSMLGVPIIRTFGTQDAWLENHFMPAVDHNTQVGYWNFVMNRWLSLRLEIISAIVLLITALVNNFSPPSVAGLSLTYTLMVTINLNWTVFQLSELSLSMSSVERVNEYIGLASEAAQFTDKDPPASWPTDCNIVMENLALKYHKSVDLVLKGISCTIKGKEKIGIVGRTGAGKSSLVSCFFRLVEPVEGSKILIDGVNILEIGLSALRSKLCIIPQDPMLFTGTIRWNLDPGNEHEDKKIWQALEECCIKDLIQNMAGGLSAQVAENGDNFSAGQKQLLCLARAVLRNSKILILDEASASLDLETDEIVQKTLRTNFKDCTVLTIAHRVHTIIDSDRIMVFDQGYLKEFDTPTALLADHSSLFSQIVDSSLQSNKLG